MCCTGASRIRSIAAFIAALAWGALACAGDVAAPDEPSRFVETHRAIVDGSVRGLHDIPLEGVDVVVDFGRESALPRPATTTDVAGEFLFVLAIFNGDTAGADSVTATVHAIARDARGGGQAVASKTVLIRFEPVRNDPPRTTVRFKLDAL
jgi:hypothetical protein